MTIPYLPCRRYVEQADDDTRVLSLEVLHCVGRVVDEALAREDLDVVLLALDLQVLHGLGRNGGFVFLSSVPGPAKL